MRRRWKALLVVGVPALVTASYLINTVWQGESLLDIEVVFRSAACIVLTLAAMWALDYTLGTVLRGMLMLRKAITEQPEVTEEDPAAFLDNPSPPNPLKGA